MLLISGGLGLGSVTKNEVVWVSNNPQHIQKRGHSTYHCLNKKKIDSMLQIRSTALAQQKQENGTQNSLRSTTLVQQIKWKNKDGRKRGGVALTTSAASPILSLDVEQHSNPFVCCRDLQILTEVKEIEREGGRGEWIEMK